MPRNTALHGRSFVPPASAAAATPAGGAGRMSNGSAASGASIATTPANQLMGLDINRLSGTSTSSLGAAPGKPSGPSSATAARATPSMKPPTVAEMDNRLAQATAKDAGATPWTSRSNNNSTPAATGAGTTLNFSGLGETPSAAAGIQASPTATGMVPTTVAACHCPNCHIQVVVCMQCQGPLQAGPENGGSNLPMPSPPAKAHSAFSVYKAEHLNSEAAGPKGTPMKAKLQMVAKMWSAASETVRAEFAEKAKQMNAAATAAAQQQQQQSFPGAAMLRGKRLRDGDAPTFPGLAPPAPVKEKVKRPPSSYMNFVAAKRAEVSAKLKEENEAKEGAEKLEGSELAKWVFKESAGRMSGMWKELAEDEKTKFKLPASATSSAVPSAACSVNPTDEAIPVEAEEEGEGEADQSLDAEDNDVPSAKPAEADGATPEEAPKPQEDECPEPTPKAASESAANSETDDE